MPWFPIVYYGILKAGAVVVPLNVLLKGREITYHLQDCGAAAYFCFEGGPELPIGEYGREGFRSAEGCHAMFVIDGSSGDGVTSLSDVLPAQPNTFEAAACGATDTAVILYTRAAPPPAQGCRAHPLEHVLNAIAANRLFDSTPSVPDTHLLTLPLFHSFGQTINMNAGSRWARRWCCCRGSRRGAALEIMEREAITMFAGVPTMYWSLLVRRHSVDVERSRKPPQGDFPAAPPCRSSSSNGFASRFGVCRS